MHRNKKLGLCFLLGPMIGLILVLIGWAIMSFVVGSMVSVTPGVPSGSAGVEIAARLINVALGFMGILCVLGIPVGLIGGIYFLAKGEDRKNTDGQLPPTA